MKQRQTQRQRLRELFKRREGQWIPLPEILSMNIAQFAEKHRLRVKRDPCGDQIAVGKTGHLFQFDENLMGLALISPNGDDPKLDNTLRSRTRKALLDGMELHQGGDYESIFLFSPENRQHARLAIRLASIKRRRRQTGKGKPLTSERARELAQIRLNNAREGSETTQSRGIRPQVEEMPEAVLIGDFRPLK